MMKQIQDFPNYYILKDGRVWSKYRERWLKPNIDAQGYMKILLTKNGKQITQRMHRLVAQAFIPNPENKPEVNHKSGIKTDNNINNLEWVTSSENMQHSYNIGTHQKIIGENNFNAKLTNIQVNEIRNNHYKIIQPYKNKIWEKYGISRINYYDVLKYRTWKHLT